MNSGKIFDHSVTFNHDPEESKKLIGAYFSSSELHQKKVLDAGCRLGYNSMAFLEKGCKFVEGVDLSKECIHSARAHYKNHKNLSFSVGDIRDLRRFKNATFDIIFCVGTLPYLNKADLKKALSEFLRVIKPGGTLLLAFQKKKALPIRMLTFLANLVPLWLYLRIIHFFALPISLFSKLLIGRNVSREYIKYDVLLSLRGLHYGCPVKIHSKYRIQTAETEYSSEKMSETYKITISATMSSDLKRDLNVRI